MRVRQFHLLPVLAIAATASGLALAAPASADCNSTGGTTLCSSGGSVRGSSGAPTSTPVYDPYPCWGTPACDYYDDYDPGVIWDLPDFGRPGIGGGGGLGGGNRPSPR